MRAHGLLLIAVFALACGSQVLRSAPDGGAASPDGGTGDDSMSNDSSGGIGEASADGDELASGDDAPSGFDAGSDVITCSPPVVYGGSSGGGQQSVGWKEACSNGHTYMAYCEYPYCSCECTDEPPDGGAIISDVDKCGVYGFGACGFPCVHDSGDCFPGQHVDAGPDAS